MHSQTPMPDWFCDPSHCAKYIGGMVFDLVSSNEFMNKLDALHLKKYDLYFINQNRSKGLDTLKDKRQ